MADLVAGARVTSSQVMEIISTSLSPDQVNAFINSAHEMIQAKLSSTDLGETMLTQIELWLSAHFLAIRDPRAAEETIADYRVKYQGSSGMGLEATSYGQQALALDWTGTLRTAGLRKATLFVV